jgi:hypothetical protein
MQISDKFLVNEAVTVDATCSLRKKTLDNIGALLKASPQPTLRQNLLYQVTCTHHHKTAFFETTYI